MKGRGVIQNIISYSAAISACEKGGQWEKPLELLKSMEVRGVEPDAISYNAAMSAFSYCPHFSHALMAAL